MGGSSMQQKSDKEDLVSIQVKAAGNHGCQKHWNREVGSARGLTQLCAGLEIEVGLLTGGQDRHYAFGLAMALVSKGVRLDFIGGDDKDSPELPGTPKVSFLNLRGNQRQ